MRIIITYKVVILLRVEINYINKRHIGSSLWKAKGVTKEELFICIPGEWYKLLCASGFINVP
jgi:hypothetical protein